MSDSVKPKVLSIVPVFPGVFYFLSRVSATVKNCNSLMVEGNRSGILLPVLSENQGESE